MEGRTAPRQNVRGTDCTNRAWRNRIFSCILRHIGRKEPTSLFVPPVYDLLQPQGFFKIEEENISSINRNIRQLENDKAYAALSAELARTIQSAENILATAKAQLKEAKTAREQRRKEKELNAQEEAELIRESQFQKAEYKRLERSWKARITTLQTQTEDWERRISALKSERKTRSAALQQKLFEQFGMLNYRGEVKNLCEIFGQTVHKTPPAGAGECAAPKLLQQAYLHGWKPIAMAEFWWGDSPKTEIRHHGHYYPACKGKCEPILQHMLQGLQVEENPMLKRMQVPSKNLEIVYEDPWLSVINKPAGMLSVPGKEDAVSVYSLMREQYPEADSPLTVHRLDMATSGLMLIAKTKRVHQNLQAQFKNRLVRKRYVALLEGIVPKDKGTVDLPLCLNPLDRPRQWYTPNTGSPPSPIIKFWNVWTGNGPVSFSIRAREEPISYVYMQHTRLACTAPSSVMNFTGRKQTGFICMPNT